MTKVISFFGKLDGGGVVLDIELPLKRASNFKPFYLDKYYECSKFVRKFYPDLSHMDQLDKIDKMLFDD